MARAPDRGRRRGRRRAADKFLEGEEITEARAQARRSAARPSQYKCVPVLCGSALKNKGVQPLLDAVVDYLPSPLDVPPVIGLNPGTDVEVVKHPPTTASRSARWRSRSSADPYVGKLAFFRVYSGTLKSGSYVLNSTQGQARAHRPPAPDARQPPRGDRRGLRGRHRRGHRPQGHLHRRHALRPGAPGRPRVDRRSPSRSSRSRSSRSTKADQDKLGIALQRLAEEDPTFRVKTDEETGQTIIAGMGELHLEVIVDRMMREFKVEANVGKPQVAYRETIRRAAEGNGRFVRQTGGQGQYGARRHRGRAERERARASSSSTRSSAARSRASTSRRSSRASARRSRRASTRTSRWSTSR